MNNEIMIDAADGTGSFMGYLALPKSGGGPAVIAIQEIFGVNRGMRQICDDLAAKGFVALSPDLFWRQEPGVQITDKTQEEMNKAFELYQGFDVDKGIEDVAASLACLRGMPEVTGKVGAVGYCLGGLLAYLTSARTSVDAGASFYGVGLETRLGEAANISAPLLMHMAKEDSFVDKAAQATIHAALDLRTQITIHDYAGVDHAFARPDSAGLNEAAAKLANERTIAFFKEHLG